MNFSHVLSPLSIGKLTLKNRFVVPPMGSFLAEDGHVSQRQIAYYSARAQGGFGLIIVEYTSVDPEGLAGAEQIRLWDDSYIPGHRRLTDEIHKTDALIFCQLQHAGRETMSAITGKQTVGASALTSPTFREMPRELSTEEVYRVIDKFVQAAVRAQKAGYDGIELHGAHQYLIAQFMSAFSNKRFDEFGGSFRNRMNFPVKIIQGIKEQCGQDFPVSIRISAKEIVSGGRELEESRLAAKLLEEAGADIISVSMGGFGAKQHNIPPQAVQVGFNAANAAYIKKELNVPVMVAGRINNPYIAEDIIKSGSADLVGLGRTSLADPEFPVKTLEGRIDEIIPCVACLQRCVSPAGGAMIGMDEWDNGVSCTYNPFTGKEGLLKIESAEQPKRIAIVGAGPAGLESAWVAAKRGHDVTVFEKKEKPGGQIVPGSVPPYKQELIKAVQAYHTLGLKYGVNYQFGVEATPELVTDFDEVVLATGGISLRPNFTGIDEADVIDAVDALEGKAPVGQNVLIVGGGLVGAELADLLGEHNHDVTVLEMKADIATDNNMEVKFMLMDRLSKHGVNIITSAEVKSLAQNRVTYEKHDEEVTLEGFDSIILAVGMQSFNPLEETLKETGKPIHVIGDAKKTQMITEAVYDGAKLGISI